MKILKVIYNNDTKFICDIVDQITHKVYIEKLNVNDRNTMKTAYSVMTRFGTKKLPLLVFEDENLVEYNAIWSERNPDWKEEINKILNDENS